MQIEEPNLDPKDSSIIIKIPKREDSTNNNNQITQVDLIKC